jgi:hypothetical protein
LHFLSTPDKVVSLFVLRRYSSTVQYSTVQYSTVQYSTVSSRNLLVYKRKILSLTTFRDTS